MNWPSRGAAGLRVLRAAYFGRVTGDVSSTGYHEALFLRARRGAVCDHRDADGRGRPPPTPEMSDAAREQQIGPLVDALHNFNVASRELNAQLCYAGSRSGGSKPSRALLKFHEGMLVFCSAVLAAIFISWPHAVALVVRDPRNVEEPTPTPEAALRLAEFLPHAAQFLIICIAATAILALATQLLQKQLDTPGPWRRKPLLWVLGIGTFGAVCAGAWAGAPLVIDFAWWPTSPS